MGSKGSLSAVTALRLPVRAHGRRVGHPTDLVLETNGGWRAIGFVVHGDDDAERFLPYAASQPNDEEIAIGSPLLLLDDVSFYARRGVSFRSLLGGAVSRDHRTVGVLRDLRLGRGGQVLELELGAEPGRPGPRVPAAESTVVPTRASAA